jgi:glycosyl transferase family 87
MKSLSSTLTITGTVFLLAVIGLAVSQTPLGSPLFLGLAAAASTAYAVILRRVWHEPVASRRLLYTAFALAVAFRVPLSIPPVDAANDMVRYVWDGRVQRMGYNPYSVVPADPAMAATHTDETRQMPSLRHRTPYPPAAQLFFRLIVTLHDSSRAMKLALVGCDLMTMIVLWRWLVVTGRSEWLTLAYAWHPLVVLEVSNSGHIDVLGALWITASAYWLARRRTLLASVALVLAIATKLLPVVLAPLFWKRVRSRDAVMAGLLLALLYLSFTVNRTAPFGSVPNVVAHIRFNGPVFRALAAALSPPGAAVMAVVLGLAVAAWARWRWTASNPAAWAWPMAVALACAPVIYPWYLLYLTPFLFTSATLPLLVWTFSVIPLYVVWDIARAGGRWAVPPIVMIAEYGTPVLAYCLLLRRRLSKTPEPEDVGVENPEP